MEGSGPDRIGPDWRGMDWIGVLIAERRGLEWRGWERSGVDGIGGEGKGLDWFLCFPLIKPGQAKERYRECLPKA